MENVAFNFTSKRAKEARIGKVLGGAWRVLLVLFSVLLLLGGAALLVIDMPVGWTVIGIAAIPYIGYEWYAHHLKSLPPEAKSPSIDGVLAGDFLGYLPN
ncbi:MAG TPA: hypothetical protein VFT59_04855, partial [Candidatus Saccharimonadales bacterium]|nr:hypothetical protein [Candidatus Saccharimonadales bacterium]